MLPVGIIRGHAIDHLLIRPSAPPERLMKSLKGVRAREANRVLGQTGEPFGRKNPTITGRGIPANSKRFGCALRRTGEDWVGAASAGLSLIGRRRREESRRGTHE